MSVTFFRGVHLVTKLNKYPQNTLLGFYLDIETMSKQRDLKKLVFLNVFIILPSHMLPAVQLGVYGLFKCLPLSVEINGG